MLVDGEPVKSCQIPVKQVQGKDGASRSKGWPRTATLHPVQAAFVEHDALQCGFCTPGMILRAVGLLSKNPQPSRAEILRFMDHNYCRCGAHTRIVDAIQSAAARHAAEGTKS